MHKKIKDLAHQYLPPMQEIRRDLHRHPELAYQEKRTSKIVQAVLKTIGVDCQPVFNTGVLATIRGTKPTTEKERVVLLRADMDALPIQEAADVAYKSVVANVMHACGHDGHTAGLLGAAMILAQIRESFSGTVKFMFQPAEETGGGARQMIEAGILENPQVGAAFGLHLYGGAMEGEVAVKPGPLYGAPDEFEIKILGAGGHAAEPHKATDPINIAMQFMTNAQNILTRKINPIQPAVISFTQVHAGTSFNVIPEEAIIGGTIRTLQREIRQIIPEVLERFLQDITHANGASYEFRYMPSYPPLVNDETMTQVAKEAIAKIVGYDKTLELEYPSLGAEDFAYLAEAVPASYYLIGIREPGKPEPLVHDPTFAWNDEVLAISAGTLAQVAYDYLSIKE